MDLITILILLLFFLLPAISRLFERKKGEAPPPEEAQPRHAPEQMREPYRQQQRPPVESDDSLAEALRQIREALGEPAPHAERRPEPPRPAPTRPRSPRPEPARRPPPPPPQARQTPPRPQPQAPPRRPTAEPRVRGATRFEKAKLPDLDLDKPLEVEVVAGPPTRFSWLIEMLHDPQEARKAIKLHEVLEPPPAIKRMGFRRR